MEGDKRRTKEDTWKSDELKRHLKVSGSESRSEDRRHREKKQRDVDANDADDYKRTLQKDQDKGRVKEKAGEKVRFKSSERYRDERRDREKDHLREQEKATNKMTYERNDKEEKQEKETNKATYEKHAKEEKHSAGKGGEKHGGKERQRTHKKHDPNQIYTQSVIEASGERHKGHHKRRDSKDHADHPKIRDEERHSEKKNEGSKNVGELSTYRDEERDHRHKKHKEHEPNKEKKRRQREKKEYEHSTVEGKDKPLKERNFSSGEEGHTSRKHRERPHQEDRHYRETSERQQKEESERKKQDHKHIEPKSQRNRSKHEDGTDCPHERSSKEKGKSQRKNEKGDTRRDHHKSDEWSAGEQYLKKQTSEEEKTNEPMKDITYPAYPDTDYDNLPNYEDDFEDYEDDFDDTHDEDSLQEQKEEREMEGRVTKLPVAKSAEVEEIQKAIQAENEKITAFVLPKERTSEFLPKECEKELKIERQDSVASSPASGKFMDFQTAKQRQSIRKMASQQKKRSFELLRLIDLDFSVSFCLLDLPPVHEYDMYIRNFGKINTKQAYVQCNEDNLDRDVQTEEIETEEKWTQHPGETALVSGGPKSNSDVSVFTPKIDSQRLASFLRSACQVIAVLLEEDQVATQPRRNLRSRPSSLSISDRCFQLNTNLPFLNGRKISCLHISHAQRQALLSVHSLPEQSSNLHLDRKFIICVWNVWQPSSPQKILFCESQVTCCCFSPSKATLVFAGTIDGSVLVWDLREDSRMHNCMTANETDVAFRSPTFSTDGVFASVSHTCPILTIEPVSTSFFKEQNCGFSYLSSQEEMLGLSFQIASMDENGTLNLWVVVELQKGDLAGSQSDLAFPQKTPHAWGHCRH